MKWFFAEMVFELNEKKPHRNSAMGLDQKSIIFMLGFLSVAIFQGDSLVDPRLTGENYD